MKDKLPSVFVHTFEYSGVAKGGAVGGSGPPKVLIRNFFGACYFYIVLGYWLMLACVKLFLAVFVVSLLSCASF